MPGMPGYISQPMIFVKIADWVNHAPSTRATLAKTALTNNTDVVDVMEHKLVRQVLPDP